MLYKHFANSAGYEIRRNSPQRPTFFHNVYIKSAYYLPLGMPFDAHGEAEGVMLEEEMFCFSCRIRMKKATDGKWHCPKCRVVFEESRY